MHVAFASKLDPEMQVSFPASVNSRFATPDVSTETDASVVALGIVNVTAAAALLPIATVPTCCGAAKAIEAHRRRHTDRRLFWDLDGNMGGFYTRKRTSGSNTHPISLNMELQRFQFISFESRCAR
jgi:hypothetical protein